MNGVSLDKQGSTDDSVVHRGRSCDGCQQFPLSGIRYRCQQCLNYDLCSSCKATNADGAHSLDHALIAIGVPEEMWEVNLKLISKVSIMGLIFSKFQHYIYIYTLSNFASYNSEISSPNQIFIVISNFSVLHFWILITVQVISYISRDIKNKNMLEIYIYIYIYTYIYIYIYIYNFLN